ncbi:hypothetical protein [Microbulbifer sp. THAF38]|uniref:hypothetical protein n=1 Tax=Microbulbifer sp. THAF38 TaxID=2587856 RepID=UPI0012690123|nr:hypothetical protein [Microbulbifer sp. THAF38]QFT53559.1 hypothetical protein FIU95_03100 [Microbulbifer sp. THAF38]
MKLELKGIRDRGNKASERIVMRALSRIDIGQFVILDAGYSDDGVNNDVRSSYWFPDQVIEKNDWVVLYTKAGNYKEKVQKSGSNALFFYWHKPEAMWGGKSRTPVLMEVDSWDFVEPSEPGEKP